MSSSVNKSFEPSTTDAHPDTNLLAKFASGKLNEAGLVGIEEHLERCSSCCESLAELSQLQDRFVTELVSAARSNDGPPDTTGGTPTGQDTPSSADSVPAEPPRTIGRFQVREQIGHGGFGVVLLADDPQLRRKVAVKIPRMGAFLTPDLRARFLREAQAAAALDHPNIVPIHEAGEADGVCYIASAYCGGPSLSSWLKQQKDPVSFTVAARLICELAGAVQHAHSRGVLHRDLKPSNILLEAEGERRKVVLRTRSASHLDPAVSGLQPKITDFGLAKLDGNGQDTTCSDLVMGTASYMSPEQARGKVKQVGAAADLYGLGSILYELLAGRPPFVGESELDTLLQVQTNEPVAPARLRPRIPRDLETICLKCLAKEPRARYPTAEELAEDLERFLAGQSIRARATSPAGKLWRWCRRNPAVAALTGCLLATLLLIAGGSTVMSIQLSREVQQREQAQLETKRSLFQAHLATARAARRSPSSGRRFGALGAIKQATAIAEEMKLGRDSFQSLRDEAIAAMLLGDLQIEESWQMPTVKFDRSRIAFDAALTQAVFIDDGAIVVQHCDDTRARKRFRLPIGKADRLAVSDDGRLLAACNTQDQAAQIFVRDLAQESVDGQSGKVAGWARVPVDHAIACFQFAPATSRLAVVASNGEVSLLKGESSNLLRRGSIDFAADGCAFHPDGVHLAVWGGRSLRVFNLDAGAVTTEEQLDDSEIRAAAWSDDGRWLAVGDSYHRVRVLCSDRPPMYCEAHDGPVSSVAFSPDGTVLASCSTDGTSRLWDPATGRLLVTCRGQAVRFSQDGQHMLGVMGSAIARFQFASGSERRLLSDGTTWNAEFNSDGTLLATRGDDTVRLWDVATSRRIGLLECGPCAWIRLWDSPQGLRLIVGMERKVQVYPLAAGGGSDNADTDGILVGDPLSIQLPDVPGRPCWPSLSRKGKLAIATDSWRAFVIDLANPDADALVLKKNTSRIAVSPNGKWLAAFGVEVSGVCVLDADTGKAVGDLARGDLVTFASFSPDGKWLVADRGSDVVFYEAGKWNLSHGTRRREAEVRNLEQCFSFATDGNMLMAGSATSESFQLIRASDGSAVATFEHPIGPARLSPDGSKLACVNEDSTLQILDLDRIRRQLAEVELELYTW